MFQFQSGAIQSEFINNDCTIESSFNSKVVRFKALYRKPDHFAYQFQFQSGAIQSSQLLYW